jgi:hypothetical protein
MLIALILLLLCEKTPLYELHECGVEHNNPTNMWVNVLE